LIWVGVYAAPLFWLRSPKWPLPLDPVVGLVTTTPSRRPRSRRFTLSLYISLAIARLERRRDPIVSYATRVRVRLRTTARPDAATNAQTSALREAWTALPADKEDIDSDGKIEGAVLDHAHEALSSFYKSDAANAFDIWHTKSGKSALMVVYFEAHRGHQPIWLVMNRSGLVIHEPKPLPRGAFLAMWRATQ
jgi:hypothetical protein